jgi:hypothetical protein
MDEARVTAHSAKTRRHIDSAKLLFLVTIRNRTLKLRTSPRLRGIEVRLAESAHYDVYHKQSETRAR